MVPRGSKRRTQKQPPAKVAIRRLGADGETSGDGAGRSVRVSASGLRGLEPIKSRRKLTAADVLTDRACGGDTSCVESPGALRREDDRLCFREAEGRRSDAAVRIRHENRDRKFTKQVSFL